eukprot:5858045-Pyramimonas_sp.AAC.1
MVRAARISTSPGQKVGSFDRRLAGAARPHGSDRLRTGGGPDSIQDPLGRESQQAQTADDRIHPRSRSTIARS